MYLKANTRAARPRGRTATPLTCQLAWIEQNSGRTDSLLSPRALVFRTVASVVGLGSVSDYILHNATCPVIVVRESAASELPTVRRVRPGAPVQYEFIKTSLYNMSVYCNFSRVNANIYMPINTTALDPSGINEGYYYADTYTIPWLSWV